MDNLNDRFRKNVKHAMEWRGWTPTDLARAMGVDPSQVHTQMKHQTCGFTLRTVMRYAKALDMDPLDLLGGPIGEVGQ